MEIKKGTIIFKQGDSGDCAYLIEKGQVEIFLQRDDETETHLTVLGQGELFGEMALIDVNSRSASTRAFSDCQLLVIQKNQLLEKVNTSNSLVQMMMKVLMQRIRRQNEIAAGINTPPTTISSVQDLAIDHLKLENQLYEAYEKNEFRLFHQPIVDLNTKKIAGSEALIRWQKPEQGLVNPGLFIDILENSSMIVPVGYWIIEECFRHYNEIKKKNPNLNFSVSINVSGRQLLHHEFSKKLLELSQKHQVSPTAFKLEIVERTLIESAAVTMVLKECAANGFTISLDDFGTGYSSLQYLADMPIHNLKIDRSFIDKIEQSEKKQSVTRSIIYLAKQLGLQTIAEGIETTEQSNCLLKMGADYGQGYLFSKPIEFDKLLLLIQ